MVSNHYSRAGPVFNGVDVEGTNPGPLSSDTTTAVDPENERLDSICETDSYGIKILYSQPSASLDIVFVHGLTGSAYSTWFHEDGGKHWPRDLIKNDISDARVMTFGYDADVARFWGQAAQDGISGYANDLLGKLARKRQRVVGGSISLPTSSNTFPLAVFPKVQLP